MAMKKLMIRNLDPDLWRQFKACVVLNASTIGETMNEMIIEYLKDPKIKDRKPE
jgi:hypothetical protein